MQAFHTDQTLNVQLFTLPLSPEFEAAMTHAGFSVQGRAGEHGRVIWEIEFPAPSRETRRVTPDRTYVAFPTDKNRESLLEVGTLDELTKALTFLD